MTYSREDSIRKGGKRLKLAKAFGLNTSEEQIDVYSRSAKFQRILLPTLHLMQSSRQLIIIIIQSRP